MHNSACSCQHSRLGEIISENQLVDSHATPACIFNNLYFGMCPCASHFLALLYFKVILSKWSSDFMADCGLLPLCGNTMAGTVNENTM